MYAAHRLCIEHYLRIYAAQGNITYTICRISNPYGVDPAPNAQGYKILNTFIRCAFARRPIEIFGDGGQLRDFIYISDVTRALFLCGLVPEARNQVINISSGHSHALLEAVETLIDLVGKSSVIFRPWPDEYRSVEPGDYIADISKARRVLGFHPEYDLESGLRETICDYRCETKPHAMGMGV
jgi:UDP-glucose 4-epimerase